MSEVRECPIRRSGALSRGSSEPFCGRACILFNLMVDRPTAEAAEQKGLQVEPPIGRVDPEPDKYAVTGCTGIGSPDPVIPATGEKLGIGEGFGALLTVDPEFLAKYVVDVADLETNLGLRADTWLSPVVLDFSNLSRVPQKI